MELRRVTDPMPQSRIESYIRRKKPGFCRDLLTVLYNISLLLRILFLKIENLRLKRIYNRLLSKPAPQRNEDFSASPKDGGSNNSGNDIG